MLEVEEQDEQPAWSSVPLRVRAATLAAGHDCFGATWSSDPLKGCKEKQGDPGTKRVLEGFRA